MVVRILQMTVHKLWYIISFITMGVDPGSLQEDTQPKLFGMV